MAETKTETRETIEKKEKDVSTDEINKTLQKIARGTGIIFTGTILSMFLAFLTRAVIARYYSVSQYGVYSLTLTMLSFAITFAGLGVSEVLPRQIPYYREKYPEKVPSLIFIGIFIPMSGATIATLLLIISSDAIAHVFGDPNLSHPITIIALAIPFQTLFTILVAITRGFGRVRERVFFGSIISPFSFLALILLGLFFRLSYTYLFVAYVISVAFTSIIFLIEIKRKGILKLKPSIETNEMKRLLLFSLPLLILGMLGYLMIYTDTLMIGYFKSSKVVGLYNAATPFARMVLIFLTSAGFIYVPLASTLYAQNKINDMRRIYQILTKWVFFLTLPLFSIFFLFPEGVISFTFGEKYTQAAPALAILSVAFMFYPLLGLSGLSLIVIGKTKLIMYSETCSSIFNVALNVILIPKFGILGASVATAISCFVTNNLRLYWLYRETSIHPFNVNYLKTLGIAFSLLLLIKLLPLNITSIQIAIPVLASFLAIYFLLILFSKSIDTEDVALLLTVEKKLGLKFKLIERFIKKFT
ncbi:MAG: flippase [Candidatus Odinarchaeota archaeon]|nr:flippase [Candidatus Odinarchaeota archaeon]